MKFTKFATSSLISGLLLGLFSCIDNDYDLNKVRGATSVGTPAILLEHSYHTNLRATNWLLSDTNLQRLADAEAAVIAAYFGL